MPTGIAIQSAANPKDAAHIDVTLDGTPAGTPTFVIARTPDVGQSASAAATSLGAGVWRVAVPHPALWYVWVSDGGGQAATPVACWAGLSDDPDLDLVGQKLQSILTDNAAALNAALQTFFPGTTMKQQVYGTATAIDDFPASLVTKPRETAEYVAFPWVRDHTYRFEIMFFIDHQDKANLLSWVTRLTARAMEILNQPAYESLMLDSGLSLAFCQCEEGESEEVQIADNLWGAIGSLVWSGKALKQDCPG